MTCTVHDPYQNTATVFCIERILPQDLSITIPIARTGLNVVELLSVSSRYHALQYSLLLLDIRIILCSTCT